MEMLNLVRNLEHVFAMATADGQSPWMSFIPFALVLGNLLFRDPAAMKKKQQR